MRMKFAACFLLALILVAPAAFAVDGITLDHVVGLNQGNAGELECGVQVEIYLRLQNDVGSIAPWTVYGSANGFRLYSPDGATWTPSFTVDTTVVAFPPPPVTTLDTVFYGAFVPPTQAGLVWTAPGTGETAIYDGGLFVNTLSVTGTGADTVGFAGFQQDNAKGVGIYEGFNEVSFKITIGSFDCANNNTQFCIDSAYYPPAGNWLWSGPTVSDQAKCAWDGPHCWTIIDPNATGATYDFSAVTNDQINFNPGTGGADRDTSFTVTSTPSNAPIGFTVANGSWMSCGINQNVTPATFTLTFDVTGFSGVLYDTLFITDNTKSPNAVLNEIEVVFDVALDVKEGTGNLPTVYSLNQNYPNPFNPTTTIKFALPEAAQVSLDIYNVLGQKIRTLVNEPLAANNYEVEWDGRNERGSEVASGIYFYKLQTDNFVNTKKMILSR